MNADLAALRQEIDSLLEDWDHQARELNDEYSSHTERDDEEQTAALAARRARFELLLQRLAGEAE